MRSNLIILFAISVTLYANVSRAQTLMDVKQESIPHSDSGGRPTFFNVAITNLTSDTIELWADSGSPSYIYGIFLSDSSAALGVHDGRNSAEEPFYRYLIPPHTPDLQLLYFLKWNTPDTEVELLVFNAQDIVTKKVDGSGINLIGIGACAGPQEPILPDTRWPGTGAAVVDGKPATYTFEGGVVGYSWDTTIATFSIVGEWSNRFSIPAPLTIVAVDGRGWKDTFSFYGAPKGVVHDTIVCTYTNCWGTVIVRNPIEGYSIYDSTHTISKPAATLVAPFLGSAEENIMIANLTDIPIVLNNLHISGSDSANFYLIDPGVIAPHDSAALVVGLRDNDKEKDVDYNSRGATITGLFASQSGDVPFLDSAFAIGILGQINVYSPLYLSDIPVLEHGVHPAGIIFREDMSPMTFTTFFTNNDAVTREFYPPFYENNQFSASVQNLPLPAQIQPSFELLQTQTTFSGDVHVHNLTKLIWPRDIDTISIDVFGWSEYAPPFDEVAMPKASQTVSLWPNPASEFVHVEFSAIERPELSVMDALGRVVKRGIINSGDVFDVSDLPEGLYEVIASGWANAKKLVIAR